MSNKGAIQSPIREIRVRPTRILSVLSLTTMPVLAWADFDAFEQVIPHTQQSIAMVPIKGGDVPYLVADFNEGRLP